MKSSPSAASAAPSSSSTFTAHRHPRTSQRLRRGWHEQDEEHGAERPGNPPARAPPAVPKEQEKNNNTLGEGPRPQQHQKQPNQSKASSNKVVATEEYGTEALPKKKSQGGEKAGYVRRRQFAKPRETVATRTSKQEASGAAKKNKDDALAKEIILLTSPTTTMTTPPPSSARRENVGTSNNSRNSQMEASTTFSSLPHHHPNLSPSSQRQDIKQGDKEEDPIDPDERNNNNSDAAENVEEEVSVSESYADQIMILTTPTTNFQTKSEEQQKQGLKKVKATSMLVGKKLYPSDKKLGKKDEEESDEEDSYDDDDDDNYVAPEERIESGMFVPEPENAAGAAIMTAHVSVPPSSSTALPDNQQQQQQQQPGGENDEENNAEFVTSGYVPDHDRIRQDAVRASQAEFQTELRNAPMVEDVVLERTTREKRVLWSLLVCVILAIVIGVVVGVVVGLDATGGSSGASLIENEICQGAKAIQQRTSVLGTTVGTTAQLANESTIPLCSGLAENGQHGVWFRVVAGDDHEAADGSSSSSDYLNATTCSNGTDFDTQLSVFQGTSCEELECVGANDDFCGNSSAFSWRSKMGSDVEYFILVHGKNDTQGNFVLTVDSASRFMLIVQEIRNEFGLDINPSDNPSTAQFRAVKWLEEKDTVVEFPFRSAAERREFRQRFALAVFYYSTRGRFWRKQLNFLNADSSVCTWNVDQEVGAVCDGNGVVRSLSFEWNDLNGDVPPEIVGLDGLLRLDIEKNSNLAPRLERISKLTTLTSLRINGCHIDGKYPREIGQLTALTSLEISNDEIKVDTDAGTFPPEGSIPRELGQLSKLEMLFLSDLWVRGIIPSQLMELTALTSLTVSDTQASLGGGIPREIRQLSNLRTLDLSGNNLGVVSGRVVPSEIGALSLLEVLDLGNAFKPEYAEFSGRQSERLQTSIGNLTGLRELYLHENAFRGTIPSSYANLVNLEKLYLQQNKLTGVIPSYLENFTSLVELGLDGNFFSGAPSSGFCLADLTVFRADEELGCWNCCA